MRYVPGCGPKNARIVIVGEAPGAEEEAQGIPFVGSSGHLLNSMLVDAGINRAECYLTNVMKVRPSGNDFGQFYMDKGRREPTPELNLGIEELGRELSLIRPNLIIALGAEPLRALTGKRGIEKWRGSILSSPHGKLIPTHHPAAILREYPKCIIAELDLKRCRTESQSAKVDLPTCNFTLAPTFDAVMEFIHAKHDRLAFDIETSGPHVHCLGFSDRPNHAIVIPFIVNPLQPQPGDRTLFLSSVQAAGYSYWTEEQEYNLLHALDRLFRSDVPLVAQNFPFDALVLSREFGFDFKNLYMDTMVAHHTCYCELPKGLDFLASIYTRHPYYSDYERSSDRSTWLYNAYDAACTLEISYRLDSELAGLGLSSYYHDHKNPVLLAATRCETRGVLVDKDVRSVQATSARARLDELRIKLRTIAGLPDFNPNSDKQVKDLLYRQLGMAPEINRRTKAETSDKHSLIRLRRKYPTFTPVLDMLGEFSEKATLLSGFLDKPLGPDGRIRTHYNIAGTVTGRWSSAEPLFDIGTNLQNMPRGEFRRMLLPDPSWLWMKADYKQGEYRVVMWDARVHRVIARYLADPNYDSLRWLASEIYGIVEEAVTKAQRQDGKNGAYGGNYGVQPYKASAIWRCPVEHAKFIIDKYRSVIPEIPHEWWPRIQRELQTTREQRGPLGNYRLFTDRLDEDMYRAAYSHRAQHLIGDLINRAFSLLDELLDPADAYLLLQVHDEVDLCVRPDRVEAVARLVSNVMTYPVQFPGVDAPLVVPPEISVGVNWYEQKEVVLV